MGRLALVSGRRAVYTARMNKFVAALLRLLGGLIGVGAVVLPLAAAPRATQEPIPYPVWTIEDVALSGYDNALAVDSAGRPHGWIV